MGSAVCKFVRTPQATDLADVAGADDVVTPLQTLCCYVPFQKAINLAIDVASVKL